RFCGRGWSWGILCSFFLTLTLLFLFCFCRSGLFLGFFFFAWLSDSGSFILSLLVVTFLHLVIGEMAPKSIAIAFPEQSAMATGVLARGYVWTFGPLLRWINNLANRLVA